MPYCKSKRVIKNGTTLHGKQNHKCKDCQRQFVNNPRNQPIPEATKQLVDK
ncbi:MAG: IS1 family transposase, partial [Pseudanabaenaceae cyanobacterium]